MTRRRNEENLRPSQNTESRYINKIETFLRKENQPYSERHIAERVFNLISKDGDGSIPTSKKDLRELSHIRNALKILVKEKKIIESLVEDPRTTEQVLHYSIMGWYATP